MRVHLLAVALLLALAAVVLAALPVAVAQEARGSSQPGVASGATLWVFFSPRQGDLAADFEAIEGLLRKHAGIALRPVLLAHDFEALAKPTEDFMATIRALVQVAPKGVQLLDSEGLAMARALGLRGLPAFALEEPGQANGKRRFRLAQGRGADLEELLR